MKELIERISNYNLFNYLFPGVIFAVILNKISMYNFILENTFAGLFLYYFIGLVISRFGSLCIEPILKRASFIEFADYSDFINASKNDDKVELFSEINNMYRTLISLLLLLLISKVFEAIESNFLFMKDVIPYVLILVLIIIFTFSYKKQTKYISKRVDYDKNKNI